MLVGQRGAERCSEASLELRCYQERNKRILLKAFIRTGWYCHGTVVFNDFFSKILNPLIDVFSQIEETVLAFSVASENRTSSPEGIQLWHRWLPWRIWLMNFLLIPPRELQPPAWRKHKIKNEMPPPHRQYSFYSSRPSTQMPRQPVLVAETTAVTDVELIIKPPWVSEWCYTEIQNSFAWTNRLESHISLYLLGDVPLKIIPLLCVFDG